MKIGGNPANLKRPSADEARKRGMQGGQASGESRRRRKSMKERFAVLMEMDRGGMEGADAIALAQFEKALGGDTRAFETVMSYLGETPQRSIKVTLPKGDADAAALPGITAAVLSAVAKGRLSPDDAAKLASVIGAHVRAVETGELADRIEALETAGEQKK